MDIVKTGQLIANVRKEKKLTQDELGKAIYRTASAVSKWERGLSFPDVFILESLAMNLGLSVMELLKGEKLADNQVLANEAEQSIRDILQLFSDESDKSRVPESFRSFFAPRTYRQTIAKILLLVGIIQFVVGGVLFFTLARSGASGILISGFVLLFFSLFFTLWVLFDFVHKKQLIENGAAITALITKIALCRRIDMPFQKSEHPYQIFFEYVFNGQNYKGKSFFIWERPELQTRELEVFVNPKHPWRYYLNL